VGGVSDHDDSVCGGGLSGGIEGLFDYVSVFLLFWGEGEGTEGEGKRKRGRKSEVRKKRVWKMEETR
jgi:hypothetical protein